MLHVLCVNICLAKDLKIKMFIYNLYIACINIRCKITDCASNVEQQALWSEFNLLKDVQHPNVIRLLGACTQHGKAFI